MRKLLSANFFRLRKNPISLLCLLFCVGFGLYQSLSPYFIYQNTEIVHNYDSGMMLFGVITIFLSAIFCPLFLGTEYSDGTMRCKLIVGHRRGTIYLANFLTCASVGLLCTAAFLGPFYVTVVAVHGQFHAPEKRILLYGLGIFAISLSSSGIFTLISMAVQKKAISAVTCLLLAILLCVGGTYLRSALQEPEFRTEYEWVDTGKEFPTSVEKEAPNPRYVSGLQRKIYLALCDTLPGGQAMQYLYADYDTTASTDPGILALYSCGLAALSVIAGSLIFRKKDLK